MNRIVPALFAASLLASGAAFAQTATGTTGAAPGSMGTSTAPMGTTPTTTPNGATPRMGTAPGTAATPNSGVGMNTTPGTAPNGTNPAAMSNNGGAPAVTTTNAPSQTTKAPVPGANSFTVGQARARIRARGFTNVTGLRKDNQGIWRGKATKSGQSTDVSLDYQGNVVSQ